MSARIPPGFAEVWMQFTLSTDPEAMFTALGLDLAPGTTATQAVTNAICTATRDNLIPTVSSAYTVGPGYVVFGNDGGDLRIDAAITPLAGTNSAGAAPQNVAMLVKKNTSAGGRRNRGRMFIPGVDEANVNPNGSFVAAELAAMQIFISGLKTALEALADVDALYLLHNEAPFTPTLITDLVVSASVATQRRRLRR